VIRTSTCPLCEASCGILVDVDGERVRSIRGDPEDPLSRGYICPKAAALVDLHEDPDRLRTPMVRTGSDWHEASWDEALRRAAEGLARIRRQHGRDAVAVYYGNPVAHNIGLMTHALPLARALRTRNVYTASSADQLPQMLAAYRMFGHLALIPVPDLERTDHLLICGANPVVSNGSLMTAPGMKARLLAIRARGGTVVSIDPRATETAAIASEHVAIRPGTDALLFAAMLQVIFAEGLVRLGRFQTAVKNLEALVAFAAELPPERVAHRTGVPVSVIRRLARDFAAAKKAACYGRVGLCTQRYGTLAVWLLQALNLVTGHLDEAGGMMFTTPAVDAVRIMSQLGMRGSSGRWHSRARGLPEFGGELPVATLADEIEATGPGRVRGLVTIAGNPVLSSPNGRRLDRALAALDHVVSIDGYLNETTRHAQVILPPAPPLSRPHYDLALYAFSVRNVAKYSEPVIPRQPRERLDWEIVSELAVRLLVTPPFRRPALAVARLLRPERIVDGLLRISPRHLTLDTIKRSPHGMDLGPLEPGRLAGQVATPDRLIDLAPDDFLRDARSQLLADAECDNEDMVLIGRRQLRDKNSWMHNCNRLVKGPPRCTLLMHPTDATSRSLIDGDFACITSPSGHIVARVEISDGIRPGVVSLPHGWGHDRPGARLAVARQHAGVSANDITSHLYLDTLSGNAAFNGLPVSVHRAAGTAANSQD
jgi:anaerobic selenocysteine-containing dehydrogenase